MAEQRVYERLKEQNQTRTVQVLAFLGLLYAFFFLPESVLTCLSDGLTNVGSTLGNIGIMTLIGAIVGYVVSAQDLLATGNSRAAQFFRSQYPSKAVMKHYNCSQSEADYLWFNIFNPWENIDSMKQFYSRTFDRGYGCRFIFVLQWAFVGFFAISLATWAIVGICGYFAAPLETFNAGSVFARVLLLLLALGIIVNLIRLNRLKGPTGCWYRFAEINGVHRTWLLNEVFAQAATYQEAVKKIADPVWKQSHGYR